MNKSTIDEIKQRFDNDVERFSNLDTGQLSAMMRSLYWNLLPNLQRESILKPKTCWIWVAVLEIIP